MSKSFAKIGHRNAITKFFITFPQSGDVGREEFCQRIQSYGPDYQFEMAICSQEPHLDGGVHLHLGVVFQKPRTKHQLLALFQQEFPFDYKRITVESMRKWQATVDYLTCPEKDKVVDVNPFCINFQIQSLDIHSQRRARYHRLYKTLKEIYLLMVCAYDYNCPHCRKELLRKKDDDEYLSEEEYHLPPPFFKY